jgi:hypothetical protein
MTQVLGAMGGQTGQPAGAGGQVDASTGVLAPRTRRTALTKTEEKTLHANVPMGADQTAVPLTSGRKKRRAVLEEAATGAGEEPTAYRPQLTGY